MNYKGTIIEESLEDKSVLNSVQIIKTRVEQVTEEDKTPWLKKWTLHTVEVSEDGASKIAEKLMEALESEHQWYIDYKNDKYHYIIFKDKVFKVDRSKEDEYTEATKHGISLGIPSYQLDFSPEIL